MKFDPYKHKEKYLRWKNSINGRVPDISEKNSNFLLEYLLDMEQGLNVSRASKKGARSYPRLNNLKQRMIYLIKIFEKRYNLEDITKIDERKVHDFFTKIRNGTITRYDGKPYKSTRDYVKVFKAFWHWHQKVNRKKHIEIYDITVDLDTSQEKPKWVYLDEKQVKRLSENAKFDYKVLIIFLFDTGIRSPTELMNIRVSDFYNNFKELDIRDEISKTFGRKIKLMMSSDLIEEYITTNKLSSEDYIFTKTPYIMNRYLKRLAKKIFGEGKSPAGAFVKYTHKDGSIKRKILLSGDIEKSLDPKDPIMDRKRWENDMNSLIGKLPEHVRDVVNF